jgi:uncharacterized membrane protein YhaH (DUF805 family)
MGFFDAIKVCLTKYVDFTGRAAPSEYWYFALFVIIGQICLFVIYQPLEMAFSLASILPQLAVAARRLHDTDRSGWWQLLIFVPVIGWIVLLIWFSQRSDEYANRFGDPPLPALPS